MAESEKVTRIKKMLSYEQETLDRYKKEITADYPSVKAEHREECLREVLKVLES